MPKEKTKSRTRVTVTITRELHNELKKVKDKQKIPIWFQLEEAVRISREKKF